jgi:hypothetical protein
MIAGTTRAALAAIDFWLSWSSDLADHADILFALKVDFRRDVLPPDLEAALQDAEPGHEAFFALAAGAPVPDLDPGDIYRFATDRFEPMSRRPVRPKSHIGRFYPERLIAGGGPGMQARHGRNPTDFFDKRAFRRTDESDDAAFYAAPLMAPRIDGRAALVVQELHEVERLGAAGNYFLLPNRIFWLPTLGIRGLPRATADACYGRLAEADPVFAAWADKKG